VYLFGGAAVVGLDVPPLQLAYQFLGEPLVSGVNWVAHIVDFL
jgi:hypothetical protein